MRDLWGDLEVWGRGSSGGNTFQRPEATTREEKVCVPEEGARTGCLNGSRSR